MLILSRTLGVTAPAISITTTSDIQGVNPNRRLIRRLVQPRIAITTTVKTISGSVRRVRSFTPCRAAVVRAPRQILTRPRRSIKRSTGHGHDRPRRGVASLRSMLTDIVGAGPGIRGTPARKGCEGGVCACWWMVGYL